MELFLKFKYRNWKGNLFERKVLPRQIYYGRSEFHPEPQWLLLGFDLDKNEDRTFALKDIVFGDS